ncbi:MAG: TolC family protein [Candidatus Mcinerneyibacterium aminivorans]|uniref:TolC family protein n=1 Tax=Candidatus Mcinerneyibacterium aminivorans TaxID=2703815 RepID=A0A5D0MIU5_9BACT|nr:MAG: TolC family protein [Candidatus Mcinerneyibacterium aminivorans]
MKKIFILAMSIILMFTAVNAENILTYENYMDKIKNNLPELDKYEVDVEKAKNSIYGAEGIDDFILDSSLNYIKEKGYQTYSDLRGVNFSTKITKKLRDYGTSVYSSLGYSRSEVEGEEKVVTSIQNGQPVYGSMDYSSDRYNPELEIGFIQPLLYNAKGILDRFSIENARINYEMEQIKRDINIRNVLNYYKKLYFEWIAKNMMLDMMKESLENVKQIRSLVEDKFQSGLVDRDDLERSKSRVINYRKQVLNYQMQLDTIEKELGVIIELDGYKPDYKKFDMFFNEACSLCQRENNVVPFEKTQNYEIIKKSLERLGLVKKISENKTLPKLNLVGNIALKTQENSFSDSMTEMNDIDYQFGISLNLPVENQQAKSEYIDSELSIERLNYELKETKNNYRSNLARILEHIKGKSQMMRYIDENISVLESEYETEREKYERARFELQFLLDTENNITDEKRNKIATKNDLIELYLDYMTLTK